MSANPTVRVGFVPSKRFPFSTEWALAMRERVLGAIAKIPGLEVVAPGLETTPNGLVENDEHAASTIALFREQQVEGVIIGALDFADEISAASVAAALGKPVLLFGTKEGPLRTNGERISDAFCGTLSISSALHRRKVPFTFAGILFPEEDKFAEEVDSFTRACAAVKAFRGARVGQVGVRPERFETVVCDETAMLQQFGQKVVPCELADIIAASRAMSDEDARVLATVDNIKSEATIVSVGRDYLFKAAKLELALIDFYRARHLSALAVQCWPSMRAQLGIMPCGVFGRITDQGVMTACEVDVLGAVDMLTQHHLALGRTVPHFIDWTVQHRSKPNMFLAWHCGNAPASLRAENTDVILRNRWRGLDEPIPEEDSGAGAREFTVRPGVVTLSRLVEFDGKFKMLITNGEIVEDHDKERGSSAWVRVADLEKLYGTLVSEGFIHHASMIHGDRSKPLAQFCQFMGIDTVVV
ncbi:MAG: L-fucose/L-arabinose isomerase family protein [Chloroflexota bacterium]